MKTLVLYDSLYGNTEQIAQTLAQTLKDFGSSCAVRINQAQLNDLAGVDLLVIGCPTQAWQLTPATRAFIRLILESVTANFAVACFDTRINKPRWLTGSASVSIARQLKKLPAAQILPSESFLVEGKEGPLVQGELERAAGWARDLRRSPSLTQMSDKSYT